MTDLSRALSEEAESSSEVSFFGVELDEATFGVALAGILVGVVLLCVLCHCFGRRVLMRYCLGRPYYCCCCPCIELCGCCQGFKRPDAEMQALEEREALHRKLKANTVMNQKLREQSRGGKVAPAPEERGIVRLGTFTLWRPRGTAAYAPAATKLPERPRGTFASDALAAADLDLHLLPTGLSKTLHLHIKPPAGPDHSPVAKRPSTAVAKGDEQRDENSPRRARGRRPPAATKLSFEASGMRLGDDYIEYTQPGRSEAQRFTLDKVTAVAAMNDPQAWTLFFSDGSTCEFRAESAAARQAWVDAICKRLRDNDGK